MQRTPSCPCDPVSASLPANLLACLSPPLAHRYARARRHGRTRARREGVTRERGERERDRKEREKREGGGEKLAWVRGFHDGVRGRYHGRRCARSSAMSRVCRISNLFLLAIYCGDYGDCNIIIISS